MSNSIGEQFTGIDMKNLIGGPLAAAAQSSVLLAKSTSDFIQTVGFEDGDKVRTVQFKYEQRISEADGSFSKDEMCIEVPLLTIVPIPNLQIDEVNLNFDMEVKQCEKSQKDIDKGIQLSDSVGAGVGPFHSSVTITGNVSSSLSNTRSSDNSAKYHVDVRAVNYGIPEGLSRVLDIMAASMSPCLLKRIAVDESGKPLTGKSKSNREAYDKYLDKKASLESAIRRATEVYEIKLKGLLMATDQIKNADQMIIHKLMTETNMDTADTDEEKADRAKRLAVYDQWSLTIGTQWNYFKSRIKNDIESMQCASEIPKIQDLYTLHTLDSTITNTTLLTGVPLMDINNRFADTIGAYGNVQGLMNEKDVLTLEYLILNSI